MAFEREQYTFIDINIFGTNIQFLFTEKKIVLDLDPQMK